MELVSLKPGWDSILCGNHSPPWRTRLWAVRVAGIDLDRAAAMLRYHIVLLSTICWVDSCRYARAGLRLVPAQFGLADATVNFGSYV